MEKEPPAEAPARQAVAQNLHGLANFLRQHPPFDQMEPGHVLELLEHCRLEFFAAGSVVLAPEHGLVRHWYLLRQGHVTGLRPGGEGEPDQHVELWPGEGFPYGALLGERPTRSRFVAAEDSFCLLLPAAAFGRLLQRSEVLRDFALRGVSGLLGRLGRQIQASAVQTMGSDDPLDAPLASLMAREPLCCLPDDSLRQAVAGMNERRVGSTAVVDEAGRLLGIFTLRDLRRAVTDPAIDLDGPIRQAMTPDPFHLQPEHTLFDAAMLMTQHHFGHVCIVADGRLVGVVSERDLFALQKVDMVHLARAMRQSDSFEHLQALRAGMPRLVAHMLAHGASAEQVLHLVTQLNDHTTTRVIELVARAQGMSGAALAGIGWIAFGSEARGEQTLLTDQDNGLVFLAEDKAQASERQAQLLPLAQAINAALDQCGLGLCPGNIMAGNPALCLAGFQWRAFFNRIVQGREPQGLLHATIFFDMRQVWGDDGGFAELQRHAVEAVRAEPAFQRLMAGVALENAPPLGGLKDWLGQALGQTLGRGGQGAAIDLKKQAITLFVDAARVLALAHGIAAASTVQRLRLLGERGHLEPARAEAYVEAFNYLQQLRLRHHQRQLQQGLALDNRLLLAELNALDQRVLRAALAQARHLQDSLRLRYQL
ncbi:CBS domain-containing protein [Corticibacter populi]|uniref:CBS domain-containing protein n=1 Tax=Corticibacter populi TaxID=1550736 RepID=A0A3M6QYX2_9BURK|nr:DUF294 nucleotidyltransferase-like domain-containing protein [Corticibacter populi]RMX07829.1 CBS domain-containing protein [Corticibacter populi]RZS35063.1 CBS domain-containing protein [Corticibacter populi]